METTKQMTWRILRIAFPMAGARLINMVTTFIGMIMIARLGSDILAASALMSAAYYTLLVIFMFILFSVGVVVSRHVGAKEYDKISDAVQQSFILAVLLSIPLSLLFWYSDRLLLLFGQSPLLVRYVGQFFHPLIWVSLPMLLWTSLSQWMVAVNKVMNVIWASVVGVGVFLLTAYPLIFGRWGMPALGVAGLSYAMLLQMLSTLLYGLVCYIVQKDLRHYAIFNFRRVHDWSLLKRLWEVGWPMSIQFGGELTGYLAITVCIGWLSTTELAAWQVVQQVLMMFVVPVFSFAEASAMVVGYTMGTKVHAQVNKVNYLSIAYAMVFVVAGVLVFTLMPLQLEHIYIKGQGMDISGLSSMISTLFYINAFVYFVDSFRNLLSGSLRGLYDTRFAMIVGILVVWVVSVGLGCLLAFYTPLGVYGFSIAQGVAFLVGAVLVWLRWRWQVKAFHEYTA